MKYKELFKHLELQRLAGPSWAIFGEGDEKYTKGWNDSLDRAINTLELCTDKDSDIRDLKTEIGRLSKVFEDNLLLKDVIEARNGLARELKSKIEKLESELAARDEVISNLLDDKSITIETLNTIANSIKGSCYDTDRLYKLGIINGIDRALRIIKHTPAAESKEVWKGDSYWQSLQTPKPTMQYLGKISANKESNVGWFKPEATPMAFHMGNPVDPKENRRNG